MNTFKKILLFIFAMFLCGFGIALITQTNLGTTPISSLPYVLTFMMPFSFGVTTFLVNMVFILGQKIILKKEFKKTDYLQILAVVFFGIFIDCGMYCAKYFHTENYMLNILVLVFGSSMLALGVTFEVIADIMYVPGEGLAKAIAYKTKRKFDRVKVEFDITQCVLACFLSLIVLKKIVGIKEGTVISALLVGSFVGLFMKMFKKIKS